MPHQYICTYFFIIAKRGNKGKEGVIEVEWIKKELKGIGQVDQVDSRGQKQRE